MPSLLFNSMLEDLSTGHIDFASDNFKMMLVTASYSPNRDAHTRRSDVSGEVSGGGYVTGGKIAIPTVTRHVAINQVTIDFEPVVWPTSTISARGAVIYKSRGGSAALDELVAFVDFGAIVSSASDSFTVTFLSPITFQS